MKGRLRAKGSGGTHSIGIGPASLSSGVVVIACLVSTVLNDISSEATRPFGPKLHLWHPWTGGLKVSVVFFYENWQFSLVAMTT